MAEALVEQVEHVYRGRIVDLSIERVRLPNGNSADLEIVRHQGAVAVVPITASGEVLLVRQYRHATGEWLLELPAGKLESGEDPASCAARELEEEVGFRPGELSPLGPIWTTPGFTDERIWLYLARQLVPGRQQLQEDEILTVETVPFEEAIGMVSKGEICDAKSICGLMMARLYFEAERPG